MDNRQELDRKGVCKEGKHPKEDIRQNRLAIKREHLRMIDAGHLDEPYAEAKLWKFESVTQGRK